MDVFELEALAELHEEEARRLEADARNLRALRTFLLLAIVPSLSFWQSLDLLRPLLVPAHLFQPVLVLVALAVVWRTLRFESQGLLRFFERPARWLEAKARAGVLTLFLVFTLSFHILGFQGSEPTPWLLVPPWFVPFLRLHLAERCLVHTVLWLPAAILRRSDVTLDEGIGLAIGVAVVNAMALAIGHLAERRHRRSFHRRWTRAQSAAGDRIRMSREIEAARRVQIGMLPETTPERPWLRVATSSVPAAEVGGDYWDIFEPDDERLVVVVADVAGHGLAAGLALAGLKAGLTLLRDRLSDPASVLRELDRLVRETTRSRLLATMVLLEFEPGGNRAIFSSAGHPPIARWRAHDGCVDWLDLSAVPLGTRLPPTYRNRTIEVSPGDILVLYSDGLVEAANSGDEPWGFEGLERALAAGAPGASVETFRDGLLEQVRDHLGGRAAQDDQTLVVLQVVDA